MDPWLRPRQGGRGGAPAAAAGRGGKDRPDAAACRRTIEKSLRGRDGGAAGCGRGGVQISILRSLTACVVLELLCTIILLNCNWFAHIAGSRLARVAGRVAVGRAVYTAIIIVESPSLWLLTVDCHATRMHS